MSRRDHPRPRVERVLKPWSVLVHHLLRYRLDEADGTLGTAGLVIPSKFPQLGKLVVERRAGRRVEPRSLVVALLGLDAVAVEQGEKDDEEDEEEDDGDRDAGRVYDAASAAALLYLLPGHVVRVAVARRGVAVLPPVDLVFAVRPCADQGVADVGQDPDL